MPNLVLGVSGSVAAYRAADLARDLMRAGFSVRVCLTDAAERFVTPDLFEALTGQPCLTDVFDEPERGRMAHIDWARQADVLLIAPATASTLNKLAAGIADDMLTTLALAYEGPVIVAPAMNPSMFLDPTTQKSLRELRERAVLVIEPAEGDVACGESGQGKLAANSRIVEFTVESHRRLGRLKGKTILLTTGPTHEAIDSVRFVGNRSSGKMGAAIAQAAQMMGANLRIVSGPSEAPLPRLAQIVRVDSAREMLEAGLGMADGVDAILGVAAVADFRPKSPFEGKIRREGKPMIIEFEPNPDVLAALAEKAGPDARAIGFAAEPTPDTEAAEEKIKRKGLYALAINDISRRDIGFGADENELTLLFQDGRKLHCPKAPKLLCAFWLLENVFD